MMTKLGPVPASEFILRKCLEEPRWKIVDHKWEGFWAYLSHIFPLQENCVDLVSRRSRTYSAFKAAVEESLGKREWYPLKSDLDKARERGAVLRSQELP